MSNAKEKGEEEQTNTRQKLSFMGLMERIVILIFTLQGEMFTFPNFAGL